MNNLPMVVPRDRLTCHWQYRDEKGLPVAIVARYDECVTGGKQKKWFHQFYLNRSDEWVEGAPTPSPLFGLDTLPKHQYEGFVYIFEGEKCTNGSHHLGLPALTSMMGASQADNADWTILAKFRHLKRFVLVPDNDIPGQRYMEIVHHNIKKAHPDAEVFVCNLNVEEKGHDLIDWLQAQHACSQEWDGFSPIDDPYCDHLKVVFEKYVEAHLVPAGKYFAQTDSSEPTFEGPPEPIEEVLDAVLPCPIETLPEIIHRWISTEAKLMQVPPDYLAIPLFYLGSLLGRKRGLRLRPGNDWVEHSNIWGIQVGRPSVMKSPAMRKAMKPLVVLALRADVRFKEALKKYEAELEAWKIRNKASEECYKKNVKNALDKPPMATNQELILQTQEEPCKPVRKRYKTDDPTVEKLGELLIENPQGLLLFRDELSGWLHSFNKPGRENDRQFFLESWTGREDFNVDRIGRGSLHIPALCLSIFGSIQPGPLTQYIRAAIKGGIGDDGFLQRFQLVVWPDPTLGWELIEGVSTIEFEEPLQDIFDTMDNLNLGEDNNPIYLEFAPDAQQKFNEWQCQHEHRLRTGVLAPHLEAHLAKYKKLLPALCLILEHLDAAIVGRIPIEVTLRTLEASINWLEYFESHANRMYNSVRNAIPKAALELIRHVKSGDIQVPFSVRDVYYKHHWSGLSDADEVKEVLDYLEERNYVAAVTRKGKGRPSARYWINPKILEN